MPLTYSESAQGHHITWTRAIRELDDHGIPSSEHINFTLECWAVHATSDDDSATIDASHVLEWLGY